MMIGLAGYKNFEDEFSSLVKYRPEVNSYSQVGILLIVIKILIKMTFIVSL